MGENDDPNAPYKLYNGDVLIGTYGTRAEARRAQQKLESEAGELWAKVGDGVKGKGGVSWGCSTPPLLH